MFGIIVREYSGTYWWLWAVSQGWVSFVRVGCSTSVETLVYSSAYAGVRHVTCREQVIREVAGSGQ